MVLDARLRLFIVLGGLFVTALVVGDILGGKLIELGSGSHGIIISVGMIPFPITFLLTDLLNEFYGKKSARFITIVAFFMALFAYTVIFVAVKLPFAPLTRAPDWNGINEASFNNVFIGSQRILVGSMAAYLLGQFLDIGTFHMLKRLTNNRFLWLRATGSTVVSQLVDTLVIQIIAWYGLLPLGKVLELAATSYSVKLVVAIGLTPFIYAGHAIVERALGIRAVVLDAAGEPLAIASPDQQQPEREAAAAG
jgi:queuosine precursor transporter